MPCIGVAILLLYVVVTGAVHTVAVVVHCVGDALVTGRSLSVWLRLWLCRAVYSCMLFAVYCTFVITCSVAQWCRVRRLGSPRDANQYQIQWVSEPLSVVLR